LLPEAEELQPGYTGLYERTGGQTRLVDVANDGALVSACGAALGDSGAGGPTLNDVSGDGSRIFFMAPYQRGCLENGQEVRPELYLREGAKTTVAVSAPQPGVTDPYGPQEPVFVGATPNGALGLFTSHQRLTVDANTGPEDSAADLYAYDAPSGRLTDLSASTDPSGAQVTKLVAFSEDGQLVYFVADGKIDGKGEEGRSNLYLSDHGQIVDVGPLGGSPADENEEAELGFSSVTPDGTRLLFQSTNSLTSYNSAGYSEVYEYNEPTGTTVCVSCNPTGAPPRGNSFVIRDRGISLRLRGLYGNSLSADGSYAFFESEEALVPQDSNGVMDVYEYHNRSLSLISAGIGYPAHFVAATPSASDVYFATQNSLVRSDTDGGQSDIYDARIGGGFPLSESRTPCASGDTCKAVAVAPAFAMPGTALATGEGPLGPQPPVSTAARKARPATRAQRLANALKRCAKLKNKHRRSGCRQAARKRYDAKTLLHGRRVR
jgi:hypothetical protein